MNNIGRDSIGSESSKIISREAAILIYKGFAKEYKKAKAMATENLGIKSFPSNYMIAIELDKIADKFEGENRKKLIINMRKQALRLMHLLIEFSPKLTGSVWRGTARKGSDIDLLVYASDYNEVIKILQSEGIKILEKKWIKADFDNSIKSFLGIKVILEKFVSEIIVRGLDDLETIEKCDIYGDLRKGLTIDQLTNILEKEPLKKFVPLKRSKSNYN